MTATDTTKAHAPITPGEILSEDFLKPLGITPYRLSKATGLTASRIGDVIHGKRRITPETGVRLSLALGLSERYWINVQADYDIEREHDLRQAELDRVERLVS